MVKQSQTVFTTHAGLWKEPIGEESAKIGQNHELKGDMSVKQGIAGRER